MGRVQTVERRRVTVNVCLDLGLLARLDEAAERLGTSRSELLRRFVSRALEEDEAEVEALADEGMVIAMEEAAADPANRERIPWEQVRGKFGL